VVAYIGVNYPGLNRQQFVADPHIRETDRAMFGFSRLLESAGVSDCLQAMHTAFDVDETGTN